MKKIVIIFIVIFIFFVGIWQFWKNDLKKNTETPEYTIEKVVRGNVAVSFSVDGKVVYEKWELNFLNSGIVDTINVKLGDIVKKGQILASLDIEKSNNQALQAKSILEASYVDLDRLSKNGVDYKIKKVAYDDALDQLDKEEDLYDEYVQDNGKNSSQALAQKVKVSSAKADVNNAKYQMKQVEENYKKAKLESSKNSSTYALALENTNAFNIIAPRNDIVVDSIHGNVGDVATQNNTNSEDNNAGFITLINKDNFWFEALLEDTDALKTQKDMLVSLTLDAYPDKEFEAKVEFISIVPEIDTNGLSSYKVIIQILNNGDTTFLSDMSGSAEIISKEAKNVLMISNGAVKNVKGKQTVTLKNGDNFSEREIQTGFTNGKKVEIKSGLEQGDEVVILK
ncbi:MAG: HlyD family efflux transporter periplasmic adaptor subunit [Candidatus Moraniibacteriota bacterium]|nr:MAG: HlyD family efflux transporter periplasmic adaptor subunit [Candidatus Moranbacteria bacterium]